jgi:hypothetical protein
MGKSEILAGVAVVALTGTIAYLSKAGLLTIAHLSRKSNHITANQAIATDDIQGAGGNAQSFLGGPAIYMANAPWLFSPNVGNVIPPNSAGVTLPGASAADFLGFNTN